MRIRASIALLVPLACLLSCTLPYTPPASSTSPLTGNWENWQIQAGTAITSPPIGLYFTGAVQVQGTQSSAVFTSAGLTGAGPATVLNFLGTYNSSTGDVGLLPATTNSAAYGIGFTQPSTNTVIPVGIVSGCVYPLNYQGVECLALISLSPAVGVEIAPLNGTYSGTLTESASSLASPIPSGVVTLVLTQSSTPNSSGQFPLTGTLTFNGGGCSASNSIGGFISGISFTNVIVSPLTSQAIPPPLPFYITAYTNPTATQITVSGLTLDPSPCSTVNSSYTAYTGTHTLQ